MNSQIAFTCLVYPSLVLSYMGEAAFLSKHHEDIQRSFYKSIPGKKLYHTRMVNTILYIDEVTKMSHCRSCVLAGVRTR